MILYRVESPDGHGPAYGSSDGEETKRYWDRVYKVAPVQALIASIVYDPPTPCADRRLRGAAAHERFAVTEDQFSSRLWAVDGAEFLWPEAIKRLEVPDELVRIGTGQCLFRAPGTPAPEPAPEGLWDE